MKEESTLEFWTKHSKCNEQWINSTVRWPVKCRVEWRTGRSTGEEWRPLISICGTSSANLDCNNAKLKRNILHCTVNTSLILRWEWGALSREEWRPVISIRGTSISNVSMTIEHPHPPTFRISSIESSIASAHLMHCLLCWYKVCDIKCVSVMLWQRKCNVVHICAM